MDLNIIRSTNQFQFIPEGKYFSFIKAETKHEIDLDEILAQKYSLIRLEWGSYGVTFDDFIGQIKKSDDDKIIQPDMLHLYDIYLVLGCLKGNDRAWEKFILRHKNDLKTAAYKFSCCKTHAEEFYREEIEGILFSKNILKNYRGKSSLRTYLFQAIKNYVLYSSRKNVCEYKVKQNNIDIPEPMDFDHPSDTIIKKEKIMLLRQIFRDALLKFSQAQKDLLHQHFYLNLSKRELARIYQIHESSLGRRLDKILTTFRKKILGFLAAHGYDQSDFIGDFDLAKEIACSFKNS